MGLGGLASVSLADARAKAVQYRAVVADRVDPIEARNADRAQQALAAAKSITFAQCAERYIETHKAGWRNAKHVWQWQQTLRACCGPVFGDLPVQDVDTVLVIKVLEPIWSVKTETASRLRGRIEKVLDWAKVRGYRTGDNPAAWRGHLDKLLPALSKRKRVQHHPALPYAQIGDFMSDLRVQEGVAARALEFTILTAARTGEVIGARWSEFDLEKRVWNVPAERMKAHRPHRVPLQSRLDALLRERLTQRVAGDEFVFGGRRRGTPLSNMAMLQLLNRMGHKHITVHGFRSTFRDWVEECTNYPRTVSEMALAHTISSDVEAAYRRGDLFEKRRRLMDDWAHYCASSTSLLKRTA